MKEKLTLPLLKLSDEQGRKKLLINSFNLLLLVAMLYFSIKGFLAGNNLYTVIIFGFFLITGTNLLLFNVRQTTVFSSFFTVIVISLLGVVLFVFFPAEGQAVLWFYTFPPLSMLLLGHKRGFWVSLGIISIAVVLYLVFPHWLSYPFPPSFMLRLVFSYVILILMVYLSEYSRHVLQARIADKNEQIAKAHKNITSSIVYAKRIQDALLTNRIHIESYFQEYFLFYKPKDVVSGDFYYVQKIDNRIYFAVADCTGHGVPGGFITMLGITYLDEIVQGKEIDQPNIVLNKLREKIKAAFTSFGSDNRNGLDIALCVLDTTTNVLQYSGAYNPLMILREGEIIEIGATKNPVGNHVKEKDFENKDVQLRNNDLIYLFSDGYLDQFGGEENRKFTKKRFKEMLLAHQDKPLTEQQEILADTLSDWQKGHAQVDDITVLGIKWTG